MKKQLLCFVFTFAALSAGISLLMVVFAAPIYTVQGKITRPDGTPPEPMTVQLMEITMSDRPAITPVLTGKSDQSGFYSLSYSPAGDSTVNVFYRISIDLDGYSIGSDPFRLNPDNQSVQIDLSLPVVKSGSQNLEIPKEILIIESMEETIRLTTILFIVNPGDALVDAKKIPFEKSIPKTAYNFQNLGSQTDLQLDFEPGKVKIGVSLTEGTKEVFFSYDLPVRNRSLEWDYQLMPGVREIEFATPDKTIELEIGSERSPEYSITTRQKSLGDRLFQSKTVALAPGSKSIPITISGIPISQKKLMIPAMVLFVILMIGLAGFLVTGKKW
jgi:hypothetical protein